MDVADAYTLIARAIDTGHAANGYLIAGDIREQGEKLVAQVLEKLFPDAREQVAAHSHPDVSWLEPEGKKRIIRVESMRERIVEPMCATSFCGGWKVGVIVGADRMEAPSANAFLKSLEEPTPKTMYLLLTDQPDAILPTIISRSQRIDLPLSEGVLTGDEAEQVAEAFAAKDAARLAAILGALKEDAEDTDVALVRKSFFRTLMSYVRKMLRSENLPKYQAYRNVEAVEEAYKQSSDRAMGDEMVLSFLMDRITFPGAQGNRP